MNKKNTDELLDSLINQTDNIKNKKNDVTLSDKEVDKLYKKYDKLSSFKYIEKNKLKVGYNIRYYNPSNDTLSTQCTIMQIQYYDISKTIPKTIIVYSKLPNVQWKILCKKYIFFERISKDKSAKETLGDIFITENINTYLKNISNKNGNI